MMILLTGGSACGKSSYAESLCVSVAGPRVYIAAMQPFGEEGERRIRKHRKMRAGKGFETIECYTGLENLFLNGSPDEKTGCGTDRFPKEEGSAAGGVRHDAAARPTVLLECICNMTANEMFAADGSMTDPVARVVHGVEHLAAQSGLLVVVTNEVGSDQGNYPPQTRAYIRAVGKINRILAEKADAVYELVCGIPVILKGKPPELLFGDFPVEGTFRD